MCDMQAGKVIAHIPARGGSKRVPAKNLRYLAGKPMIAYAIENALACRELPEVYVNTDSDDIAAFSSSLGSKVYRRPPHLASDKASGEDFTADFIKTFHPDTLVMINPVCPLLEPSDISAAFHAFVSSPADTLISCSETHMQAFYSDQPVNIRTDGPLVPTQNNTPLFICNWAVTIWNAATFEKLYMRDGSGYFGVNRIFWTLDPMKSVKVSEETDFHLAEALILARNHAIVHDEKPGYWGGQE